MILNHQRRSPREWDDAIPSLCPECSATLIPRRGRVLVWHWAHKAASGGGNGGCSASETGWHLCWKEVYHRFPGWEIEFPITLEDDATGRTVNYRVDAINGRRTRIREFVHSLSEKYIQKHLDLKDCGLDVMWIFDGDSFSADRRSGVRGGGIRHLLKPKARWLHSQIGGLVHFDDCLWKNWKGDVWYPLESETTIQMTQMFNEIIATRNEVKVASNVVPSEGRQG